MLRMYMCFQVGSSNLELLDTVKLIQLIQMSGIISVIYLAQMSMYMQQHIKHEYILLDIKILML